MPKRPLVMSSTTNMRIKVVASPLCRSRAGLVLNATSRLNRLLKRRKCGEGSITQLQSLNESCKPYFPRRVGRVAEGASLLRKYRGNSIEGSNPSLSAIWNKCLNFRSLQTEIRKYNKGLSFLIAGSKIQNSAIRVFPPCSNL